MLRKFAGVISELTVAKKKPNLHPERIGEDANVVKETGKRLLNRTVSIELGRRSIERVADDPYCSPSPIRNMPNEILVQVFEDVIKVSISARREDLSRGRLDVKPIRTPFHLAQVCGQWREILFTQPHLWSYLEFLADYSHTDERIDAEVQRFYEARQLGRRATQSLFLPFHDIIRHEFAVYDMGSTELDPYRTIEVLAFADEPSDLWSVPDDSAQEVILYMHGHTTHFFTPLLQAASSVTIYGVVPEWGNHLWSLLRELSIRKFHSNIPGPYFPLWISREEFTQLLSATPFLEKLELDIDRRPEVWGSNLPITHSRIESLAIHASHLTGEGSVFNVELGLPRLRELTLLSMECGWHIERSGAALTHLAPLRLIISQIKLSEVETTVELPRWQSKVEQLELTGPNLGAVLTSINMAYNQAPSTITQLPLPRLTTLHIEKTDIHGDSLLKFVREKLKHKTIGIGGVHELKGIRMYETPSVSIGEWKEIQALLD